MNIASFTGVRDRVAPPGQQRRGNRAPVALQRGPDPRVDRIAQALHEGRHSAGEARRPWQAAPAVLIAPITKPEAPMPAKKHVAAEIVAARPQWCKRRQQPRLQLDKTADRGRRALLHRQPHALELWSFRARFPW